MVSKLDNMPFYDRDKVTHVNWRLVKSSNVVRVGWPVDGEPLMLVEFKNGSIYGYVGATRQRVVAAAHANSVGSYIEKKIKPNYLVVRIK